MVLVDYIGIFLHFRILLTDDCVCVYILKNITKKKKYKYYLFILTNDMINF